MSRRPAPSRPRAKTVAAARRRPSRGHKWHLRLYVAGMTPRSMAAFANLKAICEAELAGEYRITLIDLLKHPKLAVDDEIVAVPTLVRSVPEPVRRLIGSFADRERTLVGLGLAPAP
ncbi:MAG TPA: circadian clock KaiB family protein [Candidatus Limnocylindria bacterium]|nr:circadian clock KaiB family protein [Candidatus Limnocylindria bacterium]